MTWRSILISQPARLSLQQSHLLIQQKESYRVPLEDIAIVMIESKEVLITAPLLSALAQQGITLLTCDNAFMPCGQWLPFSQYHRCLKILHAQIGASLPLKKRLWQLVVRQKVDNQAWVVDYSGHELGAKRLRELAKSVQSGDKTYIESQAAAIYFRILFGHDFHRGQNHLINALLNYGYAVIRAAIARSLAQYGLIPALGIHHHNELNAFNLADDLIEPFRPLIDLWVWSHHATYGELQELTPHIKQKLIAMLHHQIELDGQVFSTLSAIERSVQSFQAAILQSNPNILKLPCILPLKEHLYE